MSKDNGFDLMGMLGQLKDVQNQLQETQKELAEKRIDGVAGGGTVKVVLSGEQKCLSVEISEELIASQDRDMLQDLIVLAFNNAQEQIAEHAKNQIGDITSGLNLPF